MSVFNNTQIAFQNKSTSELRKAYWMFSAIQYPIITNLGIKVINFCIENNIPFVETIMKKTLFQQFVGGETREISLKVVQKMYQKNIGSIFDYAIEGKEDEDTFNSTCSEIQKNILFAKDNPAIPFVVFKPTGFGRLDLYEKVQNKQELTNSEKIEWEKIQIRFHKVCQMAYENQVILMVDAEESWIQTAVDDLVNSQMEKYNKEKPIIWNTIQLYRTHRLEYLEKDLYNAKEKGYFLGYKFVRGAYMEKERERALEKGYPDPILPNKESTDNQYNAAIDFTLLNLDRISAFFGTHNEESTELVINKMKEKGLDNNHPNIFFGQLYGMSDHISYYLGHHKYNSTKYLPYGPVKDVIPYLTRRARENTSVKGQTGRELSLIKKELQRRKNI